ncbi:MAG: endonuclease III [Turicibacter sp.]|nr:endonuclease III [Turicibacter sp.]
MVSKKKAVQCIDVMENLFPDAHCELNHENAFELTLAVLMSAQTTDKMVNVLTDKLFQKYKTPQDYLAVTLEELQEDVRTIGLYRMKAKNIQALCQILLDKHGGTVPPVHEELVKLPGVGRKTANVVMSVAFDYPAIAVDTHVERIAKRLGMAKKSASVLEVEERLMYLLPKERWSKAHHVMIFFGRYHCTARNPKCGDCPLLSECKFGQRQIK